MIYRRLEERFGAGKAVILSGAVYAALIVAILICLEAPPARFVYGEL